MTLNDMFSHCITVYIYILKKQKKTSYLVSHSMPQRVVCVCVSTCITHIYIHTYIYIKYMLYIYNNISHVHTTNLYMASMCLAYLIILHIHCICITLHYLYKHTTYII